MFILKAVHKCRRIYSLHFMDRPSVQGFLQHVKYLLHNFFWEEPMSVLCMALYDNRTWEHTISEMDPVALFRNFPLRAPAGPPASLAGNQCLDDRENAWLEAQHYLRPYVHERWCIEALGLVLSSMISKQSLYQFPVLDLTYVLRIAKWNAICGHQVPGLLVASGQDCRSSHRYSAGCSWPGASC